MYKLISLLISAIGLLLMMAKIYADGEPGAIPILLTFLGLGGSFLARRRRQLQDK